MARRERIPDYVDTLDGFRALATCLVLTFHYWQQAWFDLYFEVFGITVDLSPIITNGAYGVELLFMLSGFCLYYPLAMHPERRLSVGNYAFKRAVRILPSYYLCVLVSAAYQIGRLDPALLKEQFWGNMALVQMMTPGLSYNHLNGVLWSLAIEAQFYIVFPLLAKAFRKRPYATMLVAFLIGEGCRVYLRFIDYSEIGFLKNQLPPMLDVFVGGMLAAHIAAALKREPSRERKRAMAAPLAMGTVMFLMLWVMASIHVGALRYGDAPENLNRLHMLVRKFLIAGFGGAIACSVEASRWLRLALGNPVSRFISGVSYQVYLWHMWIALRLKDFHIPSYATKRPMDDEAWRWPYALLSLALTLAVSVVMTYCFERPISRFCMKHMPRWARPRETAKEPPAGAAPAEECPADGIVAEEKPAE